MGLVGRQDTVDLGRIEGEVGTAFTLDDRRTGDAGDLCVHLVRRLERGHGAAGPGVGEEHGLEHLVRSVGDEHLRRVDSVERCDVAAQSHSGAVRIAVPRHAAHLGRQRVTEPVGWWERRFVGVQADLDVDLFGVIAVHRSEVVAHRDHDGRGYRSLARPGRWVAGGWRRYGRRP